MAALFEDPFYEKYYKGRKPAGVSDGGYYVVFEGREVGIYDEWDDANAQVNKFSQSKHKGYSSYREAERALREYLEP